MEAVTAFAWGPACLAITYGILQARGGGRQPWPPSQAPGWAPPSAASAALPRPSATSSTLFSAPPQLPCLPTCPSACPSPQGKPWRLPLMIVVSLGQIYGDVLYYATCWLEGGPVPRGQSLAGSAAPGSQQPAFDACYLAFEALAYPRWLLADRPAPPRPAPALLPGFVHSRPEVLYFWFYFVIVNSFWIIIPSLVILRAAGKIITHAVEVEEAVEGHKVGGGRTLFWHGGGELLPQGRCGRRLPPGRSAAGAGSGAGGSHPYVAAAWRLWGRGCCRAQRTVQARSGLTGTILKVERSDFGSDAGEMPRF